MNTLPVFAESTPAPAPARNWIKTLSQYREPSDLRSSYEIAVTAIPFLALWALAWWSMSLSYWLAFGLSLLIAPFVVRLFTIQHDCGHSAFFRNRKVGDWVGRVLGVFTLSPYDYWKRVHSEHHSGSGNLDKRGLGDVNTLTVSEYRALSPLGRLAYRAYRNPITLFGIGPAAVFFLQYRLPLGLMNSLKYWVSAMSTNLVILAALTTIWYFGGWTPILLIFVPSTLLAATMGVWLFFVQHQFETTHWDKHEDWDLHEAALYGSSHYVMPKILQWFSANIGIHHVHHLYSRIPFYRLPDVIRDHAELADNNRMTIRESLRCAKLHLWDENSRRLLSFAEARALYG
ncbi:MAG: fatty acid desaturase [Rhodobacteraceae bacterium]|nr:fatty acid desaturase [Paracoccaceae bacterium]